MKKINYLILAALALTFAFCDKNDTDINENLPTVLQRTKGQNEKEFNNDNYNLKKAFAIALHKAMSESKELRQFIKTESLKKFDNDYDVLWNYVKENQVEGTQYTLHELLSSYFEKKEDLTEIERELPLLTIFVPSLPEKSWNAEKWDIDTEIPRVATRLRGMDIVPVFSSITGESYVLPGGLIPSYPVIVVKDNERVILPDYPEYKETTELMGYVDEHNEYAFKKVEKIEYISSSGDFRFRIPFVNFDASFKRKLAPDYSYITGSQADYLLAGGKKNFVMWRAVGQNESFWQRDFIYYDLATTTSKGQHSEDMKECIWNFTLKAITGLNGKSVLQRISDDTGQGGISGDPIFRDENFMRDLASEGGSLTNADLWTDGSFEFVFYMNPGARNDSVVASRVISNGFYATLDELFDITYSWTYDNLWNKIWGERHFHIDQATPKTIRLYNQVPIQLPWKIEDYSNRWRIRFEEVDSEISHETTEDTQKKFNNNFSQEVSADFPLKYLTLKVGTKFGTTSEGTHSIKDLRKYTENSDDLKEIIPFFGDSYITNYVDTVINFWGMNIPVKGYNYTTYHAEGCSVVILPVDYN